MVHQPFRDSDDAGEAQARIYSLGSTGRYLERLAATAPVVVLVGGDAPGGPSRAEILGAREVLARLDARLREEYRQRQRCEDADI